MNCDSIAGIYTIMLPAGARSGWMNGIILSVYVVSFLLLVPVCLMNLVTAAIVENALAQAAADREVNEAYEKQQLKKNLPRLQKQVLALDADGSGDITMEELTGAPDVVKE